MNRERQAETHFHGLGSWARCNRLVTRSDLQRIKANTRTWQQRLASLQRLIEQRDPCKHRN